MRSKWLTLVAVLGLTVGACSSTTTTPSPSAAPPTAAATSAPATAAPATAAPTAAATAAPASAAPSAAASASAPASAASSAAAGGTGGSVSFTQFAEANLVFHPVEAQSNQYMLYYLVFDTLVKLDLTDPTLQKIIPDLATSWDISPDATTFTFHLRQGVTWTDGTPFTAKDVVYTATWAAQNQNGYIGFAPAWFDLKGEPDLTKACTAAGGTDAAKCTGDGAWPGVTAPDDNTVVFTLAAPNVFFLRELADAPSVILPQHVLTGQTLDQINKGDFKNKTPIGTGPFTVKAIVPDQYVEFDANPNYWAGRPKLDTLFYKAIDTNTALAQLQSGDLDIGLNVGASNEATLKAV